MKKFQDFLREEKSQISLEMIIILAVIISVALLLINSLQKASTKGIKTVDKKVDKTFNKISKIK